MPLGQSRLVQFPRVGTTVHTSEAGSEQRQILRPGRPAVDVLEHQVLAVWRWQ
jgi:hypothetical protein